MYVGGDIYVSLPAGFQTLNQLYLYVALSQFGYEVKVIGKLGGGAYVYGAVLSAEESYTDSVRNISSNVHTGELFNYCGIKEWDIAHLLLLNRDFKTQANEQ